MYKIMVTVNILQLTTLKLFGLTFGVDILSFKFFGISTSVDLPPPPPNKRVKQ